MASEEASKAAASAAPSAAPTTAGEEPTAKRTPEGEDAASSGEVKKSNKTLKKEARKKQKKKSSDIRKAKARSQIPGDTAEEKEKNRRELQKEIGKWAREGREGPKPRWECDRRGWRVVREDRAPNLGSQGSTGGIAWWENRSDFRKTYQDRRERRTTREAAVCYNCGSTSHSLHECTRPRHGDELPFATCNLCGKKGHLSTHCDQNKNGVYPNGGSCHRCGSIWHFASKCDQPWNDDVAEPIVGKHHRVDRQVGVRGGGFKRSGPSGSTNPGFRKKSTAMGAAGGGARISFGDDSD